MAFGTGYLSSLIFLDLVPLVKEHSAWILAGIVVVFCFDRLISPYLNFLSTGSEYCSHHHHEHTHPHAHVHGPLLSTSAACSTIGCLVFCALFDGVAIRTTFIENQNLGAKVLVGQVFHLVPESIIVVSVALAAGAKLKNAIFSLLAVFAALFIGLSAPSFLAKFQNILLPVSCGILTYITFSQLLPISAAGRRGAFYALAGGLVFLFFL